MVNYYKKSYEYVKLIADPNARNKALFVYYNNLSYTYSRLSNSYAKALEFVENALKIAEKDTLLKIYNFYVYFNLGYTYEMLGKYDLISQYYLKANAISDNKEYAISDRIELLENLTNVFEKFGQSEKALVYAKKTHEMSKKYYQSQFDDNIKSLEVFYKAEQQNRHIKQLEETNKIYAKQKFLYSGIVLLSLLGILFLIFL